MIDFNVSIDTVTARAIAAEMEKYPVGGPASQDLVLSMGLLYGEPTGKIMGVYTEGKRIQRGSLPFFDISEINAHILASFKEANAEGNYILGAVGYLGDNPLCDIPSTIQSRALDLVKHVYRKMGTPFPEGAIQQREIPYVAMAVSRGVLWEMKCYPVRGLFGDQIEGVEGVPLATGSSLNPDGVGTLLGSETHDSPCHPKPASTGEVGPYRDLFAGNLFRDPFANEVPAATGSSLNPDGVGTLLGRKASMSHILGDALIVSETHDSPRYPKPAYTGAGGECRDHLARKTDGPAGK